MIKKDDLTVYIPTYNSAHTLNETLTSLVNQSIQPFEIIVSDNSSTDDTFYIISKFYKYGVRAITNPTSNIILVTNTEKGISNFNHILEHCKTKYLAIYHSDDIYCSTILEEQYNLIQKNNNAVAVFTKGKILHNQYKLKYLFISIYSFFIYYNKYDYEKLLKKNILYGNPCDFPTMFLNLKCLKHVKLNNFYEQATDLDFIFNISKHGSILRINKLLYFRRVSDMQDSAFGKQRYKYHIKPSFILIKNLLSKTNFNKFYFKLYNTCLLSERIRCYLNKVCDNQNTESIKINHAQISLFYILLFRKKYFFIILIYLFIEFLFTTNNKIKFNKKSILFFNYLYDL